MRAHAAARSLTQWCDCRVGRKQLRHIRALAAGCGVEASSSFAARAARLVSQPREVGETCFELRRLLPAASHAMVASTEIGILLCCVECGFGRIALFVGDLRARTCRWHPA